MNDTSAEILLVEDNPDDEALTLAALKAKHFPGSVDVVRDGEAALEYLACYGDYAQRNPAHRPRLILLDLKMPKVSGIEVLKFIKEDAALALIPVVILTSSREERDIAEGYKLGANSYIVKPVTYEKFIDSVRQLGMYWLLLNEPVPNNAQ